MEIVRNFILLALTVSWSNSMLLLSVLLVIGKRPVLVILFVIQFGVLCQFNPITVPGLQNVLALIHPLLILGAYSYLFYQILGALATCAQLCTNVSTIWVTLVLGGWWAYQEFTWAGWWNWDGVETPILVLSLYILQQYFHNWRVTTRLTAVNLRTNSFVFVMGVLWFVRFGGLDSVHAFISQNTSYSIYRVLIMLLTPLRVLWAGMLFAEVLLTPTYIFLKEILLLSGVLCALSVFGVHLLRTVHNSVHAGVWLIVSINFAYLELVGVHINVGLYKHLQVLWLKPQTTFSFGINTHLGYLIN